MKPDKSYKNLQAKLASLIEASDQTDERSKIKKQLEKQFMTVWQFGPDRLRLGSKLMNAIGLFRTKDDNCVEGFAHCSYYTGENDQRIIVTQPYNVAPSEIGQGLTLNDGIRPEIIDATEWAYYYPGKASLFIVKFPFGFIKAMNDFKRKKEQAKVKELLRKELLKVGRYPQDEKKLSPFSRRQISS